MVSEFPADTVVIGASADKMADQESFTQKNSLPFPLWSDPELKLIKELGVKSPRGDVPQRVTFVVDKGGVIRKVYDGKIDVRSHPKEVVAFVKSLGETK